VGSTHRASLHHLLQREIHPRVACNQVSVEGLAVLELHQHRVALRRREQAEGELRAQLENRSFMFPCKRAGFDV
jgi:hypothetical protein